MRSTMNTGASILSRGAARRGSARRGAVFATTIVVIVVLTALVLVFARSMRVEIAASGNRVSDRQAEAAERGAEQYVLSQVDNTTGDATDIMQAPAEAMQVGDGYFW